MALLVGPDLFQGGSLLALRARDPNPEVGSSNLPGSLNLQNSFESSYVNSSWAYKWQLSGNLISVSVRYVLMACSAERAGGPVNLQQNKVARQGNSERLETYRFNYIHLACKGLVDRVQAPHRPLLYS
jgi:hypothetical protein